MKYNRPEEPQVFYLDDEHRIESGENAWIFSRKYKGEDRYRFLFNSPKLLNLLILIKEFCMRRSNKKHLHEVLEEAEIIMEALMQSHDAFIRKYLEIELGKSSGKKVK